MKTDYIIERQGQRFAAYDGLLDEAHSQGLKSIQTFVIQLPNDENGHWAVMKACVTTERGTFEAIGDANPDNIRKDMVGCLIRMAETRAKARALRDAINAGVLVDEAELDHANEPGRAAPQQAKPAQTPKPAQPAQPAQPKQQQTAAGGEMATANQVRAAYVIARDTRGWTDAQTDVECQRQFNGALPSELSKAQASTFISWLKG